MPVTVHYRRGATLQKFKALGARARCGLHIIHNFFYKAHPAAPQLCQIASGRGWAGVRAAGSGQQTELGAVGSDDAIVVLILLITLVNENAQGSGKVAERASGKAGL